MAAANLCKVHVNALELPVIQSMLQCQGTARAGHSRLIHFSRLGPQGLRTLVSLVTRLPVVNMGPLRKTRYSHLARLCPEHRHLGDISITITASVARWRVMVGQGRALWCPDQGMTDHSPPGSGDEVPGFVGHRKDVSCQHHHLGCRHSRSMLHRHQHRLGVVRHVAARPMFRATDRRSDMSAEIVMTPSKIFGRFWTLA